MGVPIFKTPLTTSSPRMIGSFLLKNWIDLIKKALLSKGKETQQLWGLLFSFLLLLALHTLWIDRTGGRLYLPRILSLSYPLHISVLLEWPWRRTLACRHTPFFCDWALPKWPILGPSWCRLCLQDRHWHRRLGCWIFWGIAVMPPNFQECWLPLRLQYWTTRFIAWRCCSPA